MVRMHAGNWLNYLSKSKLDLTSSSLTIVRTSVSFQNNMQRLNSPPIVDCLNRYQYLLVLSPRWKSSVSIMT